MDQDIVAIRRGGARNQLGQMEKNKCKYHVLNHLYVCTYIFFNAEMDI